MLDLEVRENLRLHQNYCLLKLTGKEQLPEMRPGQFVQVRVDNSAKTFLRRPISINFVNRRDNELWLLIQLVGEGTRKLATSKPGDIINVLLPLGNGFTMPAANDNRRFLLIGGGVGTAPLLYLGACLKAINVQPQFLLGARSKGDLLQLDLFRQYGDVYVTTEDGSLGEKGYVTDHSVLKEKHFDQICTCGPKPMMLSVARYAAAKQIACEVSLENRMACGIGACLCCVEKTRDDHHVCVCTDGPVFNINDLKWQI